MECRRPFLSACPVSTSSHADTVHPTLFLVLGCSRVKHSHKALLGQVLLANQVYH